MLKKLLILSMGSIVSMSVQARELTSYSEAVTAINNGKRITIVADWEHCQSNYPNVKLDYIGSWTPEGIVVKKEGVIFARGMTYTHQISDMPGGNELGPVNQAYEYVIIKGQGLKIINRFVDPITYQEKIPAAKLSCEFGKGFNMFSS